MKAHLGLRSDSLWRAMGFISTMRFIRLLPFLTLMDKVHPECGRGLYRTDAGSCCTHPGEGYYVVKNCTSGGGVLVNPCRDCAGLGVASNCTLFMDTQCNVPTAVPTPGPVCTSIQILYIPMSCLLLFLTSVTIVAMLYWINTCTNIRSMLKTHWKSPLDASEAVKKSLSEEKRLCPSTWVEIPKECES